MSEKNSKALVPIKKVLPPSIKEGKDGINPFELVNGNIQLQTREDVRSLLPDILGKVLARVWLDPSFHREFSQDPQKTLENICRAGCCPLLQKTPQMGSNMCSK